MTTYRLMAQATADLACKKIGIKAECSTDQVPLRNYPSVIPDTQWLVLVDQLNNVLTGIALKSSLLQWRVRERRVKTDLEQLEDLALEAVRLRQLDPGGYGAG